jgi:hypothetical protein
VDEHDKGGALPEANDWVPRTEGKTWRDTYEERAMDFIRFMGFDGATTRQIARALRRPFTETWKRLEEMQRDGRVTIDTNEGETTWRTPLRIQKAQQEQAVKDNYEAAKFFSAWTISSVRARKLAGIEIHASYPYLKVLGESSSSTTTHPTS